MDDVTKLLDGSIDNVKAGLSGLSHDDLLRLKAAEEAGKNRKGVLDLIAAALNDADAKRASGFVQNAPMTSGSVAADTVTTAPANIPPATTIDTSGAPQQIVGDVDMSHPAVDADPRAGTTDDMNRIDFNDPNLSGPDAVAKMLDANKG